MASTHQSSLASLAPRSHAGPEAAQGETHGFAKRTNANDSVRPRILAVDDKIENLQLVGSILGGLYCELVTATDGATALQLASTAPPDLILLDILMPGMDGCEVCRRLHANSSLQDIPVIFLSALDDRELIVRALEYGGVDYITKPFDRSELVMRVRNQLVLKSARDELRRLAADKDEMLDILGRGVKSQLTDMQSTARSLRRSLGRGETVRLTQMAEELVDANNRLLAFVKEFLANSAAEKQEALRSEKVSVSALAAVVATRHRSPALRKKLKIETDLSLEAALVRGDAGALEQVMENLVSNAVKFSPPGKRIFITVRPDGSHVEWSVRDQGPGFTEEDKKHLFGRYRRLSAQPTGDEPSTGLGLSTVRKLVTAMGGELRFETALGQGTTFTVRMPRHAE